MVAKKRVVRSKRNVYKVKNKSFWAAFAGIFLLSIIVILSSIDGTIDLTGHVSAINTIAYQQGGAYNFEIRNVEGFKDATVSITGTIKQGQIKFEQLSSADAYSRAVVSSSDEDKINQLVLGLKVREKDLLAKGIAVSDIAFYVNGAEVQLQLTKKDENYLYYTTTIKEFGELVIGKRKFQEKKVEEKKVEREEIISKKPARVVEDKVEPIVERHEAKKGFFAGLWEKLFG
jgi:hypothetical protein